MKTLITLTVGQLGTTSAVHARLYEDEDGKLELEGWDRENDKWDMPLSYHEIRKIMQAVGKLIQAAH